MSPGEDVGLAEERLREEMPADVPPPITDPATGPRTQHDHEAFHCEAATRDPSPGPVGPLVMARRRRLTF